MALRLSGPRPAGSVKNPVANRTLHFRPAPSSKRAPHANRAPSASGQRVAIPSRAPGRKRSPLPFGTARRQQAAQGVAIPSRARQEAVLALQTASDLRADRLRVINEGCRP